MHAARYTYAAVLTGLTAAALTGGVFLFREVSSGDPIDSVANRHAYDVAGWEVRHLPEKWLYKIASLFDGDRPAAEQDGLIRRYFELSQRIDHLERDGSDTSSAERNRLALENGVEEVLETRITRFLRDQGLVMNPPLFSGIDLFFPPLDFELDRPPKVLAVSPRQRIELKRSYLLEPGLSAEAVQRVESETERENVSALVVGTGGVATYPSVLPQDASYATIIDTAIHEWLHQYLAFYPLGSGYFRSADLRTLNETVANTAGRELADAFMERYGSPIPPPPPSTPTAGFDFRAEMRALRLAVDKLLAADHVEDAERLMDERRDEFEQNGVYIRRINQAYFAFFGSYADTPGSIDPIGPKIERLRERAGSAARLVLLARRFSSERDLDRLLTEIG